jgi:hypothetical protein
LKEVRAARENPVLNCEKLERNKKKKAKRKWQQTEMGKRKEREKKIELGRR